MRRNIVRVVPAIFGLVVLAGGLAPVVAQDNADRWLRDCQRDDDHGREKFCELRHAGFRASASLQIDPGGNGGVAVVGWDRDSVDISIRIQADAGSVADAKEIAADVTVEAGAGRIQVRGPSTGRRESWSASLVVRVPRKSGLDIATTNGPIGVEDISGTMRLKTVNGPLDLTNLAGDVHARVQNGPMTVTLQGHSWEGTGLDAESVNGPVTLSLPDNYNAELETGTVNGPMSTSQPLTVTFQGRMKSRIHATLGKGGAPVRVVTTNGPLTIGRE